MADRPRHRCLILACGNPLRGDDGAAWHVAESAQRIALPEGVRFLVQQQWTPELAEDIADADAVLFVDCALGGKPGEISLSPVAPATHLPSFLTHHQEAASLLALTAQIFQRVPATSDLLLIGAGSLQHCDQLSAEVQASVPTAVELLLDWIHRIHRIYRIDRIDRIYRHAH